MDYNELRTPPPDLKPWPPPTAQPDGSAALGAPATSTRAIVLAVAAPAGAKAGARTDAAVAPAPPRLLDRVRHKIRARHYSPRTEKAYLGWVRRFILFHGKRHPLDMGAPEIAQFLTNLAVRWQVSASTQNQAFSALLFLYRDVLGEVSDLPCGGGGGPGEWDFFVCANGRRSSTDADRERVRTWLENEPDATNVRVGPLQDAWHGDEDVEEPRGEHAA